MFKEKQRNFTKEDLEFLYLEKNLSVKEVAETLNQSKRAVEYLLNQKYKIRKPKEQKNENSRKNHYYSDKWEISKEQLEELYIKRNLKQNEISKVLNIKPSVVKSLLESYKIHKSSELLSEGQRKFHITKEEFVESYINQNLRMQEMCLKFNCSSSTINRLRKKYRIKKPNQLKIKNFSENAKGRVSPMKGKKFTDEHKKKISEKLKGNKNSAGKKMSEYTRQRILSSLKGRKVSEEQKLKCLETKRKNGTFNTSKPEQEILKKLKLKFEEVKYQYKSMEYPFECDFYIPMLKLYIEYQGMWVHGKKTL